MNPNKALWEKGDFTEIAATMRESGEALVKSIGIQTPLRALDLGCGDGTTALPLAQLGADVTGIDIARNLVEAGNKRAAAAGLANLKFQEGDASNLEGVADHSFDLTLSMFGAMAMLALRSFSISINTVLFYHEQRKYARALLHYRKAIRAARRAVMHENLRVFVIQWLRRGVKLCNHSARMMPMPLYSGPWLPTNSNE